MAKVSEKIQALQLRREGRTYSEILAVVPVAKSTLSLWLQSVGLSKKQHQTITDKRRAGQMRGAKARRDSRIMIENEIIRTAMTEVGDRITNRELWLIGTALYWAEGAKAKHYDPSVPVKFSNSDPNMHRLFLRWLNIIGVSDESIKFEITVHDSHIHEVNDIKVFWSSALNVSINKFKYVYFKRNKVNTKRKNTGALYHGQLRVNIASSVSLNRRITGWIKGIVKTSTLGSSVIGNTSAFEAEDSRFET